MRFVVQLWSSKQNSWVISAYTDHLDDADSPEEAAKTLLQIGPMMFPKYRIVQVADGEQYYQHDSYPVVAEYTREDFLHYEKHGCLPITFEIET